MENTERFTSLYATEFIKMSFKLTFRASTLSVNSLQLYTRGRGIKEEEFAAIFMNSVYAWTLWRI